MTDKRLELSTVYKPVICSTTTKGLLVLLLTLKRGSMSHTMCGYRKRFWFQFDQQLRNSITAATLQQYFIISVYTDQCSLDRKEGVQCPWQPIDYAGIPKWCSPKSHQKVKEQNFKMQSQMTTYQLLISSSRFVIPYTGDIEILPHYLGDDTHTPQAISLTPNMPLQLLCLYHCTSLFMHSNHEFHHCAILTLQNILTYYFTTSWCPGYKIRPCHTSDWLFPNKYIPWDQVASQECRKANHQRQTAQILGISTPSTCKVQNK